MKLLRTWLALALMSAACAQAQALKLAQTIQLPNVEGRIDHLSLDAAGGRLFMAALGNNTVEVVDLRTGRVAKTLTGFTEPQGVLFLPDLKRLYIANGGDGSVRVLDATDFREIANLKFDDDADNLRYDPAARQVYVGYGSGALGVIDAANNRVVGSIPLTAHPESFQLEMTGARIFVNVPGSHTVAVLDRTSRQTVGHWSLGEVAANFPLALDEPNHRAFVGCRTPARLLVFDTQTGREIASLPLHGDCDDVFYDRARHQVYASCGEGFVDVFAPAEAGRYTRRETVKTTPKARTCFFAGDRLYLAVPAQAGNEAHLAVYDLGAGGVR